MPTPNRRNIIDKIPDEQSRLFRFYINQCIECIGLLKVGVRCPQSLQQLLTQASTLVVTISHQGYLPVEAKQVIHRVLDKFIFIVSTSTVYLLKPEAIEELQQVLEIFDRYHVDSKSDPKHLN